MEKTPYLDKINRTLCSYIKHNNDFKKVQHPKLLMHHQQLVNFYNDMIQKKLQSHQISNPSSNNSQHKKIKSYTLHNLPKLNNPTPIRKKQKQLIQQKKKKLQPKQIQNQSNSESESNKQNDIQVQQFKQHIYENNQTLIRNTRLTEAIKQLIKKKVEKSINKKWKNSLLQNNK